MSIIDLVIDENVKVEIIQLYQDFTYEGLIEGRPSKLVNGMVLRNKERRAKSILEIDEIFILNQEKENELPHITCIALLKSNDVFKNSQLDFSCLGLIWFQNELALPIDNEILKQIKTIPFKKLCTEYEY